MLDSFSMNANKTLNCALCYLVCLDSMSIVLEQIVYPLSWMFCFYLHVYVAYLLMINPIMHQKVKLTK